MCRWSIGGVTLRNWKMHLPSFQAATAEKPPVLLLQPTSSLRGSGPQPFGRVAMATTGFLSFFFFFPSSILLPTHTPPERKAPGSASFHRGRWVWASAYISIFRSRRVPRPRRDSRRQPIQQLRTQRSAPPNRPHLLPGDHGRSPKPALPWSVPGGPGNSRGWAQ